MYWNALEKVQEFNGFKKGRIFHQLRNNEDCNCWTYLVIQSIAGGNVNILKV